MLIDCSLMGSEKRIELRVPNVEHAWPFYREIMGALEEFRTRNGRGDVTKIGFIIGNIGFTISSDDCPGSQSSLSQLAEEFGVSFVAIVLYVDDPMSAAQRARDAGSRIQPNAQLGVPTHRRCPVEVIIDPFGNTWAFAKS